MLIGNLYNILSNYWFTLDIINFIVLFLFFIKDFKKFINKIKKLNKMINKRLNFFIASKF
jgi:hypothetical protein